MAQLPNDFSVFIGPDKDVPGQDLKKSELYPEELLKLAPKPGNDLWSITLKQLKNRIPSGARFCNQNSAEIDESTSLRTFVKYSKQIGLSGEDNKYVQLWYIPPKISHTSTHPLPGVQDVMPEKPTSKLGFNEPIQKPTLLSSAELRGKSNQESLQEVLSKIGGDLSSVSYNEVEQHGLKNLTADDWVVLQQKLAYMYGYYSNDNESEFLPAKKQAFRVFRKLDHVALEAKPPTNATYDGDEYVERDDQLNPGEKDGQGSVPDYAIERKIPRFHGKSGGKVETYSYNSTRDKQLAVNGFEHKSTQIALGLVTPKFSVGASGSHEKQTEKESKDTQITSESTIVATWTHPVVEIVLDSTVTEIHPDCKQRIDEIMTKGDYAMAKKFLEHYGHAFSTRIACGGTLYTEVARKAETVEKLETQRERLLTAANASLTLTPPSGAVAVKATGGNTKDSGTDTARGSGTSIDSTTLKWEAHGGDGRYSQSPVNWLPSVANFNLWQIIKHIEVIPMIDAFDDFPGCKEFSGKMRALLSPEKPHPTSQLPWLPSIVESYTKYHPTDSPMGYDASRGPVGYSLSTCASKNIRPKIPPFRIEHKQEDDTESTVKGQATATWSFFKNSEDLSKLVDKHLRYDKQRQGALPLPGYFHHLGVSDHSCTLLLEHCSQEICSVVDPVRLKWMPDALRLLNDTSSRKDAFNDAYGDRFIIGTTTQRWIHTVFNFSFRTLKLMQSFYNQMDTKKLTEKSISEGFEILKSHYDGDNISCNVIVLTSSLSSDGHVQTLYNRVHPDTLYDKIRPQVSNIMNAHNVTTELATRSFAQLLPHLDFPPKVTFTGDEAENIARDRLNVITAYVKTSARVRTPLLRSDASKTQELVTELSGLTKSIKESEKALRGFGYSSEKIKTLGDNIEKLAKLVDIQFAACHWVRRSILKEIDLWRKDLPWHQRWKKHSTEFDWAPVEADRQKWTPEIVDGINALVKRPDDKVLDYEWSFWSAPDATSIMRADAQPGCRLVGWKMRSHNGSEFGGGTWFPYSFHQNWDGQTFGWKNEEDLFVSRRAPEIYHERTGLKSHHWALSTWWLRDEDFPFDSEALMDFNQDGVNHEKPL